MAGTAIGNCTLHEQSSGRVEDVLNPGNSRLGTEKFSLDDPFDDTDERAIQSSHGIRL